MISSALRDEFKTLIEIECRETGKNPAPATNELNMSIDYFDFYAGIVLRSRAALSISALISQFRPAINRMALCGHRHLERTDGDDYPEYRSSARCGQRVVAKPSEFTPTSTVQLARIATEAGLPPGLFNVVTGTVSPAGMSLVGHELVRKIHFTGSVEAGRRIGEIAARRVVPVTLELGGKSPNLIFVDANLPRACQFAVATFTMNAGQVCSAGTRTIVERSAHEEVIDLVTHR